MSTREISAALDSRPDEVWDRLVDPDVSAARAALEGSGGRVTRHEVEGDDLVVGIDTDVPETWIPPMVRGRLGKGGAPGLPVVRRVERWRRTDDAVDGDMTITIDGVPAQSAASMSIETTDRGTEGFYEVSLVVQLPIVGRAIEQSVLTKIAGVLKQEIALLDGR